MKCIYVILSRTNTGISKVIRFLTHYELNHSSLTLSDDFTNFYAYGRRRNKPALNGGFIIEDPGRSCPYYTDIRVKIFKFEVSDEKYVEIQEEIKRLEEKRDETCYNSISALAYFSKNTIKAVDSYTCIEFICHILGIKEKISIKEFDKKYEKLVIYDGSYKKLMNFPDYVEPNHDYFIKEPLIKRLKLDFIHLKRLLKNIKEAKQD